MHVLKTFSPCLMFLFLCLMCFSMYGPRPTAGTQPLVQPKTFLAAWLIIFSTPELQVTLQVVTFLVTVFAFAFPCYN